MRISDWSSDVCSSDLLMRHVLAELEQESVEVTFVPDGGEESVTMTLGAYPVRLFTASGLIKNPENIRNLPGLYAMMAMGNYQVVARSEERRGGKECVSRCRYLWAQYTSKKNKEKKKKEHIK